MDQLRTMTKWNHPNPLDVFEVRRSKTAQPHFEYINIPHKYNIESSLVKWITKHIKNRFYVGGTVALDADSKIVHVITVGFEESKDMSYFTLACPLLKYN